MKKNDLLNQSFTDKKLPSIGISMVSYNDELIIKDCLESIAKQDYPKEKIQIVFVDGGSTDKTLEIIRKYGAKLIKRPDLKDKPYLRGEIATSFLKTDLIVAISADNRFQEKSCLKDIAKAFLDPEIVGAETLRYGYRRSDPVLCRYFALIGGADPIAVGLGKADRGPYDSNRWHSFGEVEDKGRFFKVSFRSDIAMIPTLGGNGFFVRRAALESVGGFKNSLHIDTCVRLIKSGQNKFAFIKDNHVIHYINMPVLMFLKRRILWADLYSNKDVIRDYNVFTKRDLPKLILITIGYLSVLFPLLRALKGFIKKPDPAWFLHMIICPAFVLGYGCLSIKTIFSKTRQ